MQNKRGQELSTNAIIMIVLGVVVLVVLVVGFFLGWGKIAPWLSKDNVETIVNGCGTACSTSSTFDYCSTERELKSQGTTIKTTCVLFSTVDDYSKYGIQPCPGIQCNLECEKIIAPMADGKTQRVTEEKKGLCDTTNVNGAIRQQDITSIAKLAVGADVDHCCLKPAEALK